MTRFLSVRFAKALVSIGVIAGSLAIAAPANAYTVGRNSCSTSGASIAVSWPYVTASVEGGCNPSRGYVSLSIIESRAPYKPVVVASAHCVNTAPNSCTVRIQATRRSGATYSASSYVTAA